MINSSDYVTVIGGATVDITGFADSSLKRRVSNPGAINFCAGGVARNVAENLARLRIKTRLLTAVGDDPFGDMILRDCKAAGIEIEDSQVARASSSCIDLALHNRTGKLELSIAQMDATEAIDRDFVQEHASLIRNSSLVVLDGNLNQQTIEYLLSNFSKPFFFDPAAVSKAGRIKNVLRNCHTIKPNQLEAEALSGQKINNKHDARLAASYLMESGTKEVFITMADSGAFFMNCASSGFMPVKKISVSNDKGAGDAFMAGIIYGYLKEMSIEAKCQFALAAAALTVTHEKTVNPEMSVEGVHKILEFS